MCVSLNVSGHLEVVAHKAIYDQQAVDYFLKNGWRPAFAVKKRGGYTDVLSALIKDGGAIVVTQIAYH